MNVDVSSFFLTDRTDQSVNGWLFWMSHSVTSDSVRTAETAIFHLSTPGESDLNVRHAHQIPSINETMNTSGKVNERRPTFTKGQWEQNQGSTTLANEHLMLEHRLASSWDEDHPGLSRTVCNDTPMLRYSAPLTFGTNIAQQLKFISFI